MTTRGRKPKPTHLRVVAGNPGKRPINEAEPVYESLIPPVPPFLSDEAKVEWRRVRLDLYNQGLLASVDRAALASYCQAWADWSDAEGHLRLDGRIVLSPPKTKVTRKKDGSEVTETSGGYPMQSPWVALSARAQDRMRAFMVEFGMTPSSRTRVQAKPAGGGADGKKKGSRFF